MATSTGGTGVRFGISSRVCVQTRLTERYADTERHLGADVVYGDAVVRAYPLGSVDRRITMMDREPSSTNRYYGRRRVVWGTVLLGLGLGGFFDGIVLHQILQWHHMESNHSVATTAA